MDVEISINDFVQEINKLTEYKHKIVYKKLPVNDPMQRKPDINKAKEILSWQPKTTRSEGLSITYKWFKNLSIDRLNNKKHRDFKEFKKKQIRIFSKFEKNS